jgi:membrane protein implicated in regulation of membrane protease activity
MNAFSAWWNALSAFEQTLWAIALGFSMFFVLQTIFTAFGGDTESESAMGDAEDLGDGIDFQFISLKNIVAFFTMFGWVSLACHKVGMHPALTLSIGTIAGVTMVVLMMMMFRGMAKMKHSGTLKMENAVGHTGEVYLPIPCKKGGQGKVSILLQGTLRELNAITEAEQDIPTGKLVKVTGLFNENVLIVAPV